MTHLDKFLLFLKEENILHRISGTGDDYFVHFDLSSNLIRAEFIEGRFITSFLADVKLDSQYSFDMFLSLTRNLISSTKALEFAYQKTTP